MELNDQINIRCDKNLLFTEILFNLQYNTAPTFKFVGIIIIWIYFLVIAPTGDKPINPYENVCSKAWDVQQPVPLHIGDFTGSGCI